MESLTLEEIVRDWRGLIPDLKKYTSTFLAKKAGFLLVGVRIERAPLGIAYEVFYEAYPIWRHKDDIIRQWPILSVPLKDRGYPLIIYANSHYWRFRDVAESVKTQLNPLIGYPVKASALIENLNKSLLKERDHSDEMCRLFSLKLALGCYLNDRELTEVATKEIECFIQREVTDKRVSQTGINYIYGWKSEMYALFENREQFMQIIEEHSRFPKIARLNQTDIINDLPELRELRRHAPKPPIHKRFWDWFLGRKKIEYSF